MLSPTPQMLALASALCSAVATMLIQRGLRHANFYAGFWINIAVGMLGLWSVVLLMVPADDYRWSAVACFVLSGLVSTAAGRRVRRAGRLLAHRRHPSARKRMRWECLWRTPSHMRACEMAGVDSAYGPPASDRDRQWLAEAP